MPQNCLKSTTAVCRNLFTENKMSMIHTHNIYGDIRSFLAKPYDIERGDAF